MKLTICIVGARYRLWIGLVILLYSELALPSYSFSTLKAETRVTNVRALAYQNERLGFETCLSSPKEVMQFQRNGHTGLGMTKKNSNFNRDEVFGASEARGNVFFALVMLLVIWSFSIPVEFRRARWCTSAQCVENRARCYDCVTTDEWLSGIATFYKTHPVNEWVNFDFSVDPNNPFLIK